ncbi:MAG TPA: hypothetical protein VIO32_06760 [Candidatus Baltobacteraceae bacterium]
MKARAAAAVLALSLAACASNPQRLPVGVTLCEAVPSATGFAVRTSVRNKSDRPITALAFDMSFYRDFRYSRFTGSTHLAKELDPGQTRDITFAINNARNARISGQAMQCLVTHIGYMDGTSADLPPPQ